MSMMLEIEISMTDDELFDDIYKARTIIQKLVSDLQEAASKVDIEAELIRIADDGNCDVYTVTDGWEVSPCGVCGSCRCDNACGSTYGN